MLPTFLVCQSRDARGSIFYSAGARHRIDTPNSSPTCPGPPTHLPRSVKSSEGNRSIKNFPRWWQATKYLEGNSSEFLSDRLVDVGASSCQAEDGRLPRLPCVPPPASHPHKPESHQESHSCARCKYIGPCMVPVIAAVYFCLPVI